MEDLAAELKKAGDEALVEHYRKFFQAYPGGYGEGDMFLGLKVPQIRRIVKPFQKKFSLSEAERLLCSPYHEVRFAALVLMIEQFKIADGPRQKQIFDLYVKNIDYVNNWDLVDLSAAEIPGAWCYPSTDFLFELASSGHLWRQRIAMIACWYFIRRGDCGPVFDMAEKFMNHPHDLMHKACGWMLREAGKKDCDGLCRFLDRYSKDMPRTMLRYSLEKLNAAQKKDYMSRKNFEW